MAAPVRSVATQLAAPPELTAAQLAQAEAAVRSSNLSPGRIAQGISSAAPPPDSQTSPGPIGTLSGGPAQAGVSPLAPGDLTIFYNSFLAPTTGKSTINEPSTANMGGYVFYTGNWYAARSTVGGQGFGVFPNWTYINPYADMSDFCCDQDVVADRGRQFFMWYRQGVRNNATGQNRFALGVSTDGSSFCTYFIQPTSVNAGWTSNWFDYPHLALSNNFLYITTNVFNFSAPPQLVRQVILKWPLDALSTCSGFSYSYWDNVLSGWGEPAQGATTTEYWGDHRGFNNSFRVLWNPENSGTISWVDRAIAAFNFENGDGSCPGPTGLNWCARGDSRILAGWVRQREYESVGQVGFMWNGRQGGGFPLPYVEAATFRQDTLDYTGRPLIWSDSFTWQYPFASPNARGDLGVTVSGGSTATHPSTLFAIDDDYNGTPPGWENIFLRVGNAGATAWGDYIRNRPHQPQGLVWISTGHTQQGGTSGANTEPGYYVVGRLRDQLSMWKHIWLTWANAFS
jgi:hypothetical protein